MSDNFDKLFGDHEDKKKKEAEQGEKKHREARSQAQIKKENYESDAFAIRKYFVDMKSVAQPILDNLEKNNFNGVLLYDPESSVRAAGGNYYQTTMVACFSFGSSPMVVHNPNWDSYDCMLRFEGSPRDTLPANKSKAVITPWFSIKGKAPETCEEIDISLPVDREKISALFHRFTELSLEAR